MEIRILGPLEVTDGTRVIEPGGFRQRALLARLAVAANRVVAVDALVEELWGPEAPPGAKQALQSQASRIRRALGDGSRLVARGSGYLLRLQPEELDVARFEALLDRARAAAGEADPDAASGLWSEAEALWRGPALEEFGDYSFAQAEAARLAELRLWAIEARIGTELDLGRHGPLVAELEALVGSYPYRERLWGHLMVALYRSGRQADALSAYRRVRTILGEELGITPGPALARLEEAILLQKPELTWVPRPSHVDQDASPSPDPRAETRHNLPLPRSSFVGRERELDELDKLLAEPGLVTIVGPGGVGKTRLAVEVARRQVRNPSTYVWLVELAGLADGSLVPHALAAAMGIREEAGRPLLDTLNAFLAERRAVVVLDNCEHLVEATAVLTDACLARTGVTVLATSREPLRIEGEVVWRTPSLPIPPEDVTDRDAALTFGAVRLFWERARTHRRFDLHDGEHTAAVAELCRRLDGIPLALELAAARTPALSVEEILARLDDRFGLLSHGQRTAPLRHQTLYAAIDWSHDLLSAAEATLFRRLSVFAAGFTVEAADEICHGHGLRRDGIVALLSSLVDKSFLLANTDVQPTRFRLLESLREYGRNRLALTGELEWLQERLLHRELELAGAAEAHLAGPEQKRWMSVIAEEIDDIRSVLEWAITTGHTTPALKIAVSLLRYWEVRGVTEGRERLDQLLASEDDIPGDLRVRALSVMGVLAAHQGDHERVRWVYEEALIAARELSDDAGLTRALLGLGHLAYMQGDYGPSVDLCTQSLELSRALGDLRGEAASLHVLGRVAHFQLRTDEATSLLMQSLAVRERMGDPEWIAVALGALAELALRGDDLHRARAYCRTSLEYAKRAEAAHQQAWVINLRGAMNQADGEFDSAEADLVASLALLRQLDDRPCTARALIRLSQLRRAQGDHRAALVLAQEGLALASDGAEMMSGIECLEQIASVLTEFNEHLAAVTLFACTSRLRTDLEVPLPPRSRATCTRDLATACSGVGDAHVAAGVAGMDLSLADARRSAAAWTAKVLALHPDPDGELTRGSSTSATSTG